MQKTSGQYLTFLLNEKLYALPISTVREIIRYTEVTAIPKSPKFVAGVINLRGKVIPVISLRDKFLFATKEHSKETCLIIIDTLQGSTGVIVDAVQSVITLTEDQIDSTNALSDGTDDTYIMGLGRLEQHVLILIDINRMLSRDHLVVLKSRDQDPQMTPLSHQ